MLASGGVTLVSKLVTSTIMWSAPASSWTADDGWGTGRVQHAVRPVSSPILRLAQLWNDFQQVAFP